MLAVMPDPLQLSPDARAVMIDAAGPGNASEDAERIAPRLTDWRGRTLGTAALLLRPATVAQVQAIVRAAAAHRVAIVPQGGMTGLVGGALPTPGRAAILLSTERLSRIRSVDPAGLTLVAEAGVTLHAVHEAAAHVARRFPLSLAARGSATVGGLVSTNAGGTQVLRHGVMRARVLGLEAVLPDGSLLQQLGPLAKDNTGLDIKQLMIGAEGTLGIVTAAALALAPIPTERIVAWAALASPAAALALLADLRTRVGDQIESFELIPGEGAALVAQHMPQLREPLPGHPWAVLLELGGTALMSGLEAALLAHATDAVIASNNSQADALWAIREAIPEMERRDGPAVKHDIALPVATVPAFMTATETALAVAVPGARVFAFGHMGDGNLHYNVRAPVGAGPDWLATNASAVSHLVHDRVAALGGSISAEHGIGAFKMDELARLGDPAKLAAMRAIKHALDPLDIMNPGKLAFEAA